jgi:hypothetical protein
MNIRNRKEFEEFKELQEFKNLFAFIRSVLSIASRDGESIRGQSRNYCQYDADFFVSDIE